MSLKLAKMCFVSIAATKGDLLAVMIVLSLRLNDKLRNVDLAMLSMCNKT